VLDLPGHGRSRWPPGTHDLATLARAVFTKIPRGAAVLGWSLGGLVALELARRHPRHLRALVLVATTPKFVAAPDWEHGMAPAVLDGFSRGLARDYRKTVQGFLSLQTRGDERALETLRLLRSRLAAHGEPDPAALATGLAILRDADLRDALPRLALPALVIAGEHDRLTPPAAGEALARGLPSARYHLVGRSGHAPFLSHAAQVTEEVRSFLARHPAAARA
jgi:pimeloyl-[acyl-carrier protein] methyl ester esterase